MSNTRVLTLLAILATIACGRQSPAPYGPVPSRAQLEWQQMEYNMFVHFGPNTFSGAEWGEGTESEDIFCPTDLDCRQWARIAYEAGMKGIIITAKHHDGFCLWPSATSTHTVAQSSWRGGQGDVLKELSDACKEYGLKFGVYLSPWDRNHPAYGTPEYNEIYMQALREIHCGTYGPVFEQWFDGACGEGPSGKRQEYDWPSYWATVRDLSPETIIFSNIGPGCRWGGNENGHAGLTNWSRLDTAGFSPGAESPPKDTLNMGNVHGAEWIPAEMDVSIRPGWFWRESENGSVKSLQELQDIWLSSVGRNSLLLLNVPPDTQGRIHPADSARLMEFRAWREDVFGNNLVLGAKGPSAILDADYDTYWVASSSTPAIEITLSQERTFDLIMLQEYIPLGQRVSEFRVEALRDSDWEIIAEGTTIGYKRIIPVPTCTAQRIRICITASFARPVLSEVGLFQSACSF